MKYLYIFSFIFIFSCGKDDPIIIDDFEGSVPIRAVDLSDFPKINNAGIIFKDENGDTADLISMLKEKGVNTVRLRLWHTPSTVHSSLEEVTTFASQLHDAGLQVWLTPHFSDTWADPGKQITPAAWQQANFSVLKDSVYRYTKKIMKAIAPDFIQIGNEINAGILLPMGNKNSNNAQFLALLSEGSKAVREVNPNTQIIIHYAGMNNPASYFSSISIIDYDIAGLSYYPIWHGKELNSVQNTIEWVINSVGKPVVIAETAYPFTLGWNDWTNNILGSTDQIIPDYPASPEGQLAFMMQIRNMAYYNNQLLGFCYWGAELVAFDGPESKNGSVWENQAIFDFNYQLLPVNEAFRPI